METHFDAMEQAQGSGVPREKVMDDLKTLVRDSEELLKATASDMSERAQQARSRLSAAVERAKGTCKKLEEKTVAAARATDQVIRQHPYESIGVAFAVGVVIGVLVGRR